MFQSKRLAILIGAVVLCAQAASALVVGAFDGTRAERPVAGSDWSNLRALLANPANFGPGGIVEDTITFAPAIALATAANLAGLDLFIVSEVSSLSVDEQTAIRDFVLAGGYLILQSNSSAPANQGLALMAAALDGGSLSGSGGNNGATAGVFITAYPGAFGNIAVNATFGATMCSILVPGSHTTVLAQNGSINMVGLIPAGELGAGSGAVLLLSDVLTLNYFVSPATLYGSDVNDWLLLNFFAEAAGATPAEIPTLSQWGILLLGAALLWASRRRLLPQRA